jgi:hypothetical protein
MGRIVSHTEHAAQRERARARTFLFDHTQRCLELRAAIAAQRAKHIARAALRVHAHEQRLIVRPVPRPALAQRNVLVLVSHRAEGVGLEGAVLGRHARGRARALDERVVPQSVGDLRAWQEEG